MKMLRYLFIICLASNISMCSERINQEKKEAHINLMLGSVGLLLNGLYMYHLDSQSPFVEFGKYTIPLSGATFMKGVGQKINASLHYSYRETYGSFFGNSCENIGRFAQWITTLFLLSRIFGYSLYMADLVQEQQQFFAGAAASAVCTGMVYQQYQLRILQDKFVKNYLDKYVYQNEFNIWKKTSSQTLSSINQKVASLID